MPNILINPESGFLEFNTGSASGSAFDTSLSGAARLKFQNSGELNLTSLGTGVADKFTVDGSNGRLLTVNNTVTGSIFSVNDVAGLPIVEVFSDDRVVMGQYATDALVVSGSGVSFAHIPTVSGNPFITGFSEGDTLQTVTDRGATTTNSITTNGLASNGNITTNSNGIGIFTRTLAARDSNGLAIRESTSSSGISINSAGNTFVDGDLAVDTDTLFVDISEDRVGIGTNVPSDLLSIVSTVNNNGFRLDYPGTSNTAYPFYIGKADDSKYVRVNANGIALKNNGAESVIKTEGSQNDLNIQAQRHLILTSNETSEAMRIASDGNVGIGTNNPAYKLDVQDAAAEIAQIKRTNAGNCEFLINPVGGDAKVVFQNSGTDIWAIGKDNSDSSFRISEGGALETNPRFTVDNGGNVGIGTTNPAKNLSVYAAGNAQAQITGTNVAILSISDPNSHGQLNTYNDGTFRINSVQDSAGTQLVLSGSNVGIGVANPSEKLTVNGNIRINGDSREFYFAGNQAQIRASSASTDITFVNSSTELVRFASDGNVGIGTNDPRTSLHVSKGGTTEGGIITIGNPNNTDGSYCGIEFINSTFTKPRSAILAQRTGGAYDAELTFHTSPNDEITGTDYPAATERMRIDHDGNVGIATNSPDYKLDVVGTARITGGNVLIQKDDPQLVFHDNTSSTYDASWMYQNNAIKFVWGGGHKFKVDSAGGVTLGQSYSTSETAPSKGIITEGRVGLGTTSPSATLHVADTTNETDGKVIISGTGTSTNAADVYIYGSGNSDVINAVRDRNDASIKVTSTTAGAYFRTNSATAIYNGIDLNNNWFIGQYGYNDLRIVDGTAGAGDAATAIAIQNSTKYVGIGTTNPVTRLHVIGDGVITEGNAGIGTTAPITRLVVDTPMNRGQTNPSGLIVTDSANGAMALELGVDRASNASYIESRHTGSNTNYTLLLNPSYGKVGVGTVSPTSKFEVGTVAYGTTSIAKFWDGTDGVEITNRVANRQQINFLGSNTSAINAKGSLFINYDTDNNGSNDSIQFTRNALDEAGTLDMIITEGQVGIGTNNPHTNQQLHIYGAGAGLEFSVDAQYANATRILSYNRTAPDAGYKPFFLQSSELRIDTNGSRRMTVDSAGNVGIGTATPAVRLHVTGDGEEIARFESSDNEAYISIKDNTDSIYVGLDPTRDVMSLGFDIPNDSTTNLSIDTAGNVGIGTNDPKTILDIDGAINHGIRLGLNNALIGEGSSTTGTQLLFWNGTSAYYGRNGAPFTHTVSNHFFRVGGNDEMAITASGVGINKTSPDADLNVDGRVKIEGTTYHSWFNFSTPEDTYIRGGKAGSAVFINDSNNGNVVIGSNASYTVGGTAKLSIKGSSVNLTMGPSTSDLLYFRRHSTVAGRFQIQPYYGGNIGEIQLAAYGDNDTPVVIGGYDTNAVAGVKLDVRGNISGSGDFLGTGAGNRITKDGVPYLVSGDAAASLTLQDVTDNGATTTNNITLASSLPKLFLQDTDGTNQIAEISKAGSHLYFYNRDNVSNGGYIFLGDNGTTDTEFMRIDTDGKVGIGSNSPDANLDVTTTANQQHLKIQGGYAEGVGALAIIKTTANGNALSVESATTSDSREIFEVKNSNGTVFEVQGDGKVGIGSNNPERELTVSGRARIWNSANTKYIEAFGGNSANFIDSYNNSLILRYGGDSNKSITLNSAGNVGIGTISPEDLLTVSAGAGSSTTDLVNVGGTGNGRMLVRHIEGKDFDSASLDTLYLNYISSGPIIAAYGGGNVGIGTNNPQELLHLDGSSPRIRLRDTDAAGTPYAHIDASNGSLLFESDKGNEIASSNIIFTVDNTEAMRIDASGNVGIGTATPSGTLHVFDTGNVSGDMFIVDGSHGRLFNVSDETTGIIFSVNDAAGLPIVEVDSTSGYDKVSIGEFGTNALVVSGSGVGVGVTGSREEVLEVYPNKDESAIIGKAHIGYLGASDHAKFSHVDFANSTQWAFGQTSNGSTQINTKSAGEITFLVNTVQKAKINGDGDFQVDTDTLYVDASADRVGIGTDAPNRTLHVNGRTQLGGRGYTSGGAAMEYASLSETNGGASTILGNAVYAGDSNNTYRKTSSDDGNFIALNYNKGITFHTHVTGNATSTEYDINNHEQVRITTGGFVGIGTIVPDSKVHIYKNSAGSVSAISQSTLVVENNSANAISMLTPNNTTSYLVFGDPDDNQRGYLSYTHTDDTMRFKVGGDERMFITGNGNISIGTTALAPHKLNVKGTISRLNSAGIQVINLQAPSDHGQVAIQNSGGTEKVLLNSNGNSYFNGGNFYVDTDTLYVDTSNDRVGIGTNAPSYDLDVVGTTRSTYYIGGAYFEENASSSKIKFYPNGTVLVMDEDGELKPCEKENDTLVFGVSKRDFEQPIVLGAEPILVTGPIKVGDYIVTSNKQGHGQAMKEQNLGTIIAQAMENGDGESYNIKAMIRKM